MILTIQAKSGPTQVPGIPVNRVDARAFLGGLPERTFFKLESEGIITAAVHKGPGKASIYDLTVITPAYIKHLKAQSGWQTEQAARARREQSQAELNEIKLAKQRGEILDAAAVGRSWAAHITEARNALLGVPTQAKAAMPELTRDQVATIDRIIRAALERLSD